MDTHLQMESYTYLQLSSSALTYTRVHRDTPLSAQLHVTAHRHMCMDTHMHTCPNMDRRVYKQTYACTCACTQTCMARCTLTCVLVQSLVPYKGCGELPLQGGELKRQMVGGGGGELERAAGPWCLHLQLLWRVILQPLQKYYSR